MSTPDPSRPGHTRTSVPPPAHPQTEPGWRKAAGLVVLAALCLAAVCLSPIRDHAGRLGELKERIQGFGALAPLVLCLSTTALVAAGFPRLFFCVISGMALGFWQGLLCAQLGALAGSYLAFLAARLAGGEIVGRWLVNREDLRALIRRESLAGVLLARQLPVPALLVNVACGAFSIRHRTFLLGTLAGQLPAAIPCVLIGAGMLRGSPARSATWISMAAVLAIVLWLVFRAFLRRVAREQ